MIRMKFKILMRLKYKLYAFNCISQIIALLKIILLFSTEVLIVFVLFLFLYYFFLPIFIKFR